MGASLSNLGSNGSDAAPGLNDFPEGCVARVFLHLTPSEICNLARLNRAFPGAASADSVCQTKLRRSYQDLLDLMPLKRHQTSSRCSLAQCPLMTATSHTACIAAENNGIPVRMHGHEFGRASGMAPRARIAVYKALYRLFGGFVVDVVAAIDQAVEPNDRKIGKLCEYASKNPLRIPKITNNLEQRCYKDLRNENYGSVKLVLCIYRKLLSTCKEQMPLFANRLLGIIRTLLEQTRADEMQILGCNTLVEFIDCQHAYNPDEEYTKVESQLRAHLESFLETARTFNLIYTKV